MRGDYDYHHANSNTQFLAIIGMISLVCVLLGGLFFGLFMLTSIL